MLVSENAEHEPFPDYGLKYSDCKGYAYRPWYHYYASYLVPVSAPVYNANLRVFYSAVGIVCDKLTHQPRKLGPDGNG
jgi:hypothetical protein